MNSLYICNYFLHDNNAFYVVASVQLARLGNRQKDLSFYGGVLYALM